MKEQPTINDYEWDDSLKIPPTVHGGLRWNNEQGHECRSHLGAWCFHKKTGKRIARLAEHSLVDTCAIGAMHWYASILVRSPDVYDLNEGKHYAHGCYGPEKPEAHLDSIRIEATRKLLKPEKDMSGARLCKVGERTYRFNSAAAAKAAAIAVFKRKFAPGWVLLGEDLGDSDDSEILAQT